MSTAGVPGIVLAYGGPQNMLRYSVAIRHWLIVSTFIAFNLLLHFLYRKRREDRSCES